MGNWKDDKENGTGLELIKDVLYVVKFTDGVETKKTKVETR